MYCFTDVNWKRRVLANNVMGVYMRGACKQIAALLLTGLLTGGCTVLPEAEPVAIDQYLLEYHPGQQAANSSGKETPVLIVTTPAAYGGYDSARIAYMREVYSLRYYSRSQWADKPTRMLAPLIADALQATGQFQALYAAPGAIAADYRLDTELVRLHQDFTVKPSVVRMTLRASLIALQTHRVVATEQFDVVEAAATDDTYGGVVAANKAVNRLLTALALFCVQQH